MALKGRFQVLGHDVSGACWIIAASDNPREAFSELDALPADHHCVVWDDQLDRGVVDLDEALDTLEEEREDSRQCLREVLEVRDLLNDFINRAATDCINGTTEAEVFKGFTDEDSQSESKLRSKIDAKVRTRRGEG